MIIKMTIYVAQLTKEIQSTFDGLHEALELHYPGEYELNIINVLEMPEKAIADNVFVTPTLIRQLPEPVLRVLGDLSDQKTILTAIQLTDDGNESSIVV